MDISELCESKGTNVHGIVVGELSPVKESHNKAGVHYFDGQLSNGKKTARIVSFAPTVRGKLERLKQSSEVAVVSNCIVQRIKQEVGK
jgi:hypothetical protein